MNTTHEQRCTKEQYGDIELSIAHHEGAYCTPRKDNTTGKAPDQFYTRVEIALIDKKGDFRSPSSLGLPAKLDNDFESGASGGVAGWVTWNKVDIFRRLLAERQ